MAFKRFRYFVRLDSKGQVVLGSLIARTKKPKEGKWEEFEPTARCCRCTTYSTVIEGSGVGIESFDLELTTVDASGGSSEFELSISPAQIAFYGDLEKALNGVYGFLADFKITGSALEAKICFGEIVSATLEASFIPATTTTTTSTSTTTTTTEEP